MATSSSSSGRPAPMFPRLPGGPGGREPKEVARHQRARLQGAMLEAVGRHGFAATTVSELVGLAGVSKATFYALFENKEECFLETFDAIVADARGQISRAYAEAGGGLEERLRASLKALMELVEEERTAAGLVIVDSLTLGTSATEHRTRAAAEFERLLRRCFEHAPERGEISELASRAIIAGVLRVIYRRLRVGRPEQLRRHVDELIGWGLRYERSPGSEIGGEITATAEDPGTSWRERGIEEELAWEEPPDSRRSRSALDQRERIIRAAAQVATEKGYAALSIPVISGAAGVSNQTFYEHFSGRQEAFLAAFEVLSRQALRAATEGFAEGQEWAEKVAGGVRALLEFIASNRIFARLAFFELPTAGPAALDRADEVIEGFTSFFHADFWPVGMGEPPAEVVVEAIGGGMWALMQHEIAQGRAKLLPQLSAEITAVALAPVDLV